MDGAMDGWRLRKNNHAGGHTVCSSSWYCLTARGLLFRAPAISDVLPVSFLSILVSSQHPKHACLDELETQLPLLHSASSPSQFRVQPPPLQSRKSALGVY